MASERPPYGSFEKALSNAEQLALDWSKTAGSDPQWADHVALLPSPPLELLRSVAGQLRARTNAYARCCARCVKSSADFEATSSVCRSCVRVLDSADPVWKYWRAVEHYGGVDLNRHQRLDLLRCLAETNANASRRCVRCEALVPPADFDGASPVCRACVRAMGEPRPRGRRSNTHGDEFIRAAAQVYAAAVGQRHEVVYKAQEQVRRPFARFLCLIGVFLAPPARRPSNIDAYLHNARDVVSRRRAADRRLWQEKMDGYVQIQITAPVAIHGYPPGATLTLPAFEGQPIDRSWRHRIEEGAAVVVREILYPEVLRDFDRRPPLK